TPLGQQRLPEYERPARLPSVPLTLLTNTLASKAPAKDEIDDQRAKLGEANVAAVLRIGVRANDQRRAAELFYNLDPALHSLDGPSNRLTRRRYHDLVDQQWVPNRLVNAAGMMRWPMQLSETELMALACWPVGEPNTVGLPQTRTVHIPATADVAREGIGI